MDNYAADVDEEAAGKFNFTMFCQVRSDGLQFESGQYALPKTTFFFKYRYTFFRHPCFNLRLPILADQDLNVCIQGVPQLSIHFVSIILTASTHPNCKS